MAGICPSCKKPVTRVIVDNVEADDPRIGGVKKVPAFTISCSMCRTILSAELHPSVIDKMKEKP